MASKTVTRSIRMSCVGAFLFSNQNSINVCQTSKGPRNLFQVFWSWERRYKMWAEKHCEGGGVGIASILNPSAGYFPDGPTNFCLTFPSLPHKKAESQKINFRTQLGCSEIWIFIPRSWLFRENLGIHFAQFDLHSLWKVNFIVTLLKVQTNLVRHIIFFSVFVVGTNKFWISTTFLQDFAWNDRSIWRLFGRISCSCTFYGCCLKMRI